MTDFNLDEYGPKGFDFISQCRQFLYDFAPDLNDEQFDEAMATLEGLGKIRAEETRRKILGEIEDEPDDNLNVVVNAIKENIQTLEL
jgi:hypothetical protein